MNMFCVGSGTDALRRVDRVVGEVEPGREAVRPGRPDPDRSASMSAGLPTGLLRADLRLVVAAGVLAVGDVDDVVAVAADVVADAEARHDAVRCRR